MPIHFGDFALDDSRRQVLRAGEAIHLSPKAFQLLSILVQESPRAISKADLQEQLWPGTFVTEGSLATLVGELRSALGDDAKEPRFIRTLYGFGYSFAAPVAQEVAQSKLPRKPRLGHLTGAAAFGAVAIILILALRSTTGSASAPPLHLIRSLAVLPFDTTGADRADEHLGLGLPDLLITRLSNVRQVVVRPTSAIREFAGRGGDWPEIGRQLKVDAVLEGSIRTSPDRVRVTVQLLNVREQKPIWAERFDEKRADMFAIEDNISARVAEALTVRLTPNEKMLLAKRYTANPEAYRLYVQGRYQLQRSGSGRYDNDGFDKARDFLEKAVEKDPSFAAAWASLAHTYSVGSHYGRFPASTALPKAEAAALKALQLDDSLSEAHTSLGNVKNSWYFDFPGAEREYIRALELNPSDTYALLCYAYLLQCLGRFDEAITFRNRHIDVDPLSPDAQWGLANAYITSGQYDRAMQQVALVLGMEPNYAEAHIGLIRLYIVRGEYEKAIAEAREQAKAPENIRALAFLGYAYGRAGRQADAKEVLQRLTERSKNQHVPYFHFAIVYAGLGDREAVLPLLERGLDDHEYALRLKTEPIFTPFHTDPRFIKLLQRAGFKS
jgi:TolB-like protein/DNA-binding winged helix-turn-helix (wHTH) protein/tetratricopeptide (TPR) repeat protein